MIALSSAATIRTREQLDAVVENIVQMRLEQAALESAQENEIAAVREKYRAPLVEVDRFLQMETAWVETWAEANPAAFDGERLLNCARATIGFRLMPPRVERASRKWTWTAAALKLADTTWGKRYLRIPSPEVDKEAILSDFASLPVEELRQAGIKIIQGERFFIESHLQTRESPIADETAEEDWQEAA